MIVEIIYGHYEDESFKSYVKLKHILSFDTEHNTIFLKKIKLVFLGYQVLKIFMNF